MQSHLQVMSKSSSVKQTKRQGIQNWMGVHWKTVSSFVNIIDTFLSQTHVISNNTQSQLQKTVPYFF